MDLEITEFKVKTTTKFVKIARAYAEKKGVDLMSLRFAMDGERITIPSEQTVTEVSLAP
jgi:small ubiquitin-related modifier